MNNRKNNHKKIINQSRGKGKNPYKALNSYEETDQKDFFGREEDVEKLLQLVKFNSLTVVFGKSGIGKTSLLNAGLFPRLRHEDFRPIRIRLNFAENVEPLKEQIRSAIEIGLASNKFDKNKVEVKSQIDGISSTPLSADETLWEYFHRVIHSKIKEGNEKIVTPVLIFDQFEEIFTLGKFHKEREKFIDELYWLLEDQFPFEIKQRVKNGDKEARLLSYSKVKPNFKVILSLREDYLPYLNELTSRIPSIDRTLFRVIHLNGKQGRKVIEIGFDKQSVPVVLRCFYQEEIMYDQKKEEYEEKVEIEPVFLSLLCHQLFEKQPLKFLTKQEQDKILEDFYDSVMKKFPDEVKVFIEEKLLSEGGWRMPFYQEPGHPLNEAIDRLVDYRILRKFHDVERVKVEIIHDVLAYIIKEQREKRLKIIREKKEKEQLRKRFYRKFIVAVSAITLIAFLFALYAFYQKGKANEQYRRSQIDRLIAQAFVEFPKDNSKAIRSVEEAIKISKGKSTEGLLRILSEMGYSSISRPFYTTITPLESGDAVYSAVFTSDNQRILTAHENGSAYIRDLEGKILLELKGHTGRIMSAVFSPDENLILTTSWDKTARLWNRKGRLLNELKHDGPLTCASFSPDGKQILTASLDHTARLWNFQDWQLHEFKHQGRVISASFSPDGNRILTASWDKTAKLWDQAGGPVIDLNKHTDILYSAIFSPDGHYILTGSRDRTALLWNDHGEALATFNHDSEIIAALFSPDGKLILTVDLDGTVKLWDRESRYFKTSIKHEGIISTVLFSPGGNLILTASENGAINLWNLQGNQVAHFDKHSQKIYAAAFAPNGNHLFTASEGEFSILWDMQPNIVVVLKHNDQVSDSIFSRDGESILTRSDDGIASLWDNTGKFLARFRHGRIIKALFSAKRDCVITASSDGAIKCWDRQGNCTYTFNVKVRPLMRVIFSEDGSKLLPLSNSTVANVFNLQGKIIREFQYDEKITDAVFSPNEENLITVSSGDKNNPDYQGDVVNLWNLNNVNDNNPIFSFNQENIASTVFSPNNSLILTASTTGEVIVRNLSGKILHRLNLAIENRELLSATFSPDSKRILSGLSDGLVTLSNLKGASIIEFKHSQNIYTAVFSPDGQHVLTASLDKTAKLWDLGGNLLATFQHEGAVFSASFSSDGTRVVTASRDETAKIWLTPSAILQWLENSKIPQLTEDEKNELKISPYEK